MKPKLSVFVLVIALSALAAVPSPAAALPYPAPRDLVAGPCAPGAAYDPACDVNHDGAVNVLDVQHTAGHWNQAGAWLGDNDHGHLGQTWIGVGNPLTIQGAFTGVHNAPLILSNSGGAGDGLHITSVDGDGV